jgi:hypothetical protein
MKHAIYALLALCLVLSASPYAKAQDNRLIITSPTTGDKVQVALEDLGKMEWENAKKACAKLGDGWRLPTKEEMEVMYRDLHQKGRGNFNLECMYWSGTEYDATNAWAFHFYTGEARSKSSDDANLYGGRGNIGCVRAVRALD